MEKSSRVTLIGGVVVLLVIVGVLVYAGNAPTGPSKYDGFAKCLTEKGAKFYGAFWCQHCQNQKKMFGTAKQYLPYIECSTADRLGQTPVCKENKIVNYPTWVFPDLSTTTGEVQLPVLSEKTGCPLPSEGNASAN